MTPPQPETYAESQLATLICDLSQNMQVVMENMLKEINEIDQNIAGIIEELEESKESALQRKATLEGEKDQFQKATFAVLDMLNGCDPSQMSKDVD